MTTAEHILRWRRFFPQAIVTILLLWIPSVQAGSATWSPNPASGVWDSAANWLPMTVPGSDLADIASFAVSTQTSVSLTATAEGLSGISFDAGAGAYNIKLSYPDPSTVEVLAISGFGITNNSGKSQNFSAGGATSGEIRFTNSATAGSSTVFNNAGGYNGFHGAQTYGYTLFLNSSTAGDGTFINHGSNVNSSIGAVTSYGGSANFWDGSTAGNGTFINNGGTVTDAAGGQTRFNQISSAANSTLIANGGTGGGLGGEILFLNSAIGGTARVEVFGNGSLHIEGHNAPGLSIASIAGTGKIFLGSNNLTVGNNNLNTNFSGQLEDFGSEGSLTKVGTGTLTLSGSNAQSGPTLVSAGTLQASHDGALGKGKVVLTASGVALRLQGGVTNNYIGNLAGLDIASGATVDLNFTGPADIVYSLAVAGVAQASGIYGSVASGAPHQLPQFTGLGTLQVDPVSNVDFSGDGRSDIVFQNNLTGERIVWVMNGTVFVKSITLAKVSTFWNIAGVGDFNHDGRSDILWQNSLTGECLIWFMKGTGFAGKVSLGRVATSWRIAGVGDFNADASSDILWQNSSGACAIWLMNGAVRSSSVYLGTVSTAWKIVGSGNFNDDGTSDILWQHTSGARAIWLMEGTVHRSSVSLGIVATSWNIAGRGDFNGDGKSDILWEHTSGARAIWLMNGTVRSSVVSLGTVPTAWGIKNY